MVDALFKLLSRIRGSRLFYAIIGSTYIVPGDIILYWSFSIFLHWTWPLLFFIYGFVAIHMILGLIASLIVPDILRRVKPEIMQSY